MNGLGDRADFAVGSGHDLPVRSGAIHTVFGIAILHHLDLEATAREVHRVLGSGGRAIFHEPVRDSSLSRAARQCIPYRAADISPFERPLTTRELQSFAKPFRSMSMRAFSLPFVNVTRVVPLLRRYTMSAYRLDGAILRRIPALNHFAGGRVFSVTK